MSNEDMPKTRSEEWADREEHRDVNIQRLKKDFEEAQAEATTRFGWVDEITLNTTRAGNLVDRAIIDGEFFHFSDDQAAFQLTRLAAKQATLAALNSDRIARDVRLIKVLAVFLFGMIVGDWLIG